MKSCSIAPLDAVGDFGHHARKQAHGPAHARRQFGRSEGERARAVALFFHAHLRHDGTRSLVRRRQALKMSFEMLADLALGLGKESEAPAVAKDAGADSENKRSCVPERVQEAQPSAEFLHSLR